MIFHADMMLGKDADLKAFEHLKSKTVICATRIEPPIHPNDGEKIQIDFGMWPEEWKEKEDELITEYIKENDFDEDDEYQIAYESLEYNDEQIKTCERIRNDDIMQHELQPGDFDRYVAARNIVDKALEDKRGGNKIGSTLKGIGPTYTDKISRNGNQIYSLLEDNLNIISDDIWKKSIKKKKNTLLNFINELSNS